MKTIFLALIPLFLLHAADRDIFDAARADDAARVKQLIADHVDIDKPGANGFTPLILAAYNGSPEVVAVLLANHADVHVGSRMGNALMAASFQGHVEIAAQLIKAGARVNDANESGGTALMYAALSGRTKVVQLLIANGAQVTARDHRGLDAATLAEQQGNQEMADLLRNAAKPR
ncbi:MAG: ankyrin repeat domain-containing protein [Bryobacteraceae bacterium]